ncbi:glycosyltransferase, partial [Paraconexibacter sp.]|uniref:glycosyltransferase n=1 Tax=Paraconexibacter sp. TaxID=2949640 RepID=UPI0035674B5D
MKIVSVMTTRSPGGAEFAAVEMLDGLVARGHECVMVSNDPGIARSTGVQVAPIEIGPKLAVASWPGLMLRWPLYVRRLRAALEAQMPYDVLLVHYKKEQLMARQLPSRLRPTLAWCEWGPVPFPLRKGLPRRLYVDASRHADVILAISQGTKDSVSEVGVAAEDIVVVPNALRTEEIDFTATGRERVRGDLGIPADAFVVGCISRFHPKKRNDVVVEAVKRLPGDAAHLILAGSGETEAELRALGAPLGERLHVIDTPRGDVADVLSAFDVSVFCPSPTEGQPRAVILGMLARRPCVSTGAEGVADMIAPEFGAITVPENDP